MHWKHLYSFMISSFSGVLFRSTPTVQSTHLVEYEAKVIKNKIEIRPIDALFEVLGITTISIYLVFQFIPFQFEWHSNLSDIQILVTF